MTNVNICLFVYSDDIIVVLTPDKNIRKIEDNFLNAINAILAPSGDQAKLYDFCVRFFIQSEQQMRK